MNTDSEIQSRRQARLAKIRASVAKARLQEQETAATEPESPAAADLIEANLVPLPTPAEAAMAAEEVAPVVSFPNGNAAPPAPEPAPFPFPSLDFPDRTTISLREIALRLGYSEKHISNLLDAGRIAAIDGRVSEHGRSSFRIPVESYRDFVLLRLKGKPRAEMLRLLPKDSLQELARELNTFLSAS